tara:strand:+ start:1164 stop:1967 length:804 start_codon:yes stop_codon:yes gene_type:complete
MGINKKLFSKELTDKLAKQSTEDILREIPDSLIQFSRNKVINYCLSKKVGLKAEPSPRVLVNWVEKGLVKIDKKDKGKIKRFDKLESTWLNILVELRGFGLSLESLERMRNILFNYIFNDFSLFKFQFLNTIVRKPQTLIIYKDGDTSIIPTEVYLSQYKKRRFLTHISLNLDEYIKPEYTNFSLEQDFNIKEPLENIEKMKLLYFLRTGDYLFMKVKLEDGDIRYFEDSKMLLKNDDVLNSFSKWNFKEILISIDDEVDTVITSKL